jgi:hypothetical protein
VRFSFRLIFFRLEYRSRGDHRRSAVGLRAEGATAAEAVDRLAEQVRARVTAGAQITELNMASCAATWMPDAGYLRDEPLYEPWREAMEDYRRKLDEDPEAV